MDSQIKHGGMDGRSMGKVAKPKKELDHMRIEESENGGHAVTHHFTSFEHPPELHTFAQPGEEVELPEGHVLQHVAKHLGIPHSVIEEKEQSADKTDAKATEPSEEEELEHET